MRQRLWVPDSVESQHLVSEVLAPMHTQSWLLRVVQHCGFNGWWVGLPDLGSGWEVTCDVLSMRIPDYQEKGEECSAVSSRTRVWTFGLAVERWTNVWEVVGSRAGADSGFPVGGGADPRGEGCQHTILSNFPKNCMKSRTFWAVGGAPPESATVVTGTAGLSLRIFRHSYCGRVVQKSHSSTPKFTRPHLERTKYVKGSEAKP